jgi:hypothetical protein
MDWGYGVTCRQTTGASEPQPHVVIVVSHVEVGDRVVPQFRPLEPEVVPVVAAAIEAEQFELVLAEAVVEVAPVDEAVVPVVLAPLQPEVVPRVPAEVGPPEPAERASVGECRRTRGHVERYGKRTGRQQGDALRS